MKMDLMFIMSNFHRMGMRVKRIPDFTNLWGGCIIIPKTERKKRKGELNYECKTRKDSSKL